MSKKKKPNDVTPVIPTPPLRFKTESMPQQVIKPNDRLTTRERWLFWGLLAFGALIRFFWLGRASYMIDEINVVRDAATQAGYAAIYHTELERFTFLHRLPLLMLILRFMFTTIAYMSHFPPEWLARLPFAIFGTLSLPLFYLLGKLLKNKRLGLWCMFLVTISVFHTYYSREAYDYSLLIFFVTGTLWSSAALLRSEFEGTKASLWRIAAYVFFSVGVLQAHLTGLLFLGPLNALMFLFLFRCPGGIHLNRLGRWLVLMSTAYLVFVPFLIRLLGGFQMAESPLAKRFSLLALSTLLGRMGWGESLWTLIPFVLFLISGLVGIYQSLERRERYLLMLLALQLLVYLIIQSWMLRISRFEVRYYSALFPLLIVFVAFGIDNAVTWFSSKSARLPPATFTLAVVVPLFLWLAPSLWNVCALQARGYSYKEMAQWICQHVPAGGVYAHSVIFEMRGVPNVYATPERIATFVSANSTDEDSQRYPYVDLVRSFVSLNSRVYLLEIAPADLLAPEMGVSPVPRDELFARHVWLTDPPWERLIRLKTLPPGEVQMNSANMPKVLVSWSEPDDLRELALRQGRSFYHDWGPQWEFVKQADGTPRLNINWMKLVGAGQLQVGNTTPKTEQVEIQLTLLSPEPGCLLTITAPDSTPLLKDMVLIGGPRTLQVPAFSLPSGTHSLSFDVKTRSSFAAAELYVHAVEIHSSSAGEESKHHLPSQ